MMKQSVVLNSGSKSAGKALREQFQSKQMLKYDHIKFPFNNNKLKTQKLTMQNAINKFYREL